MKTKSRPKIKDVAKMVGVSSTLVSLVLTIDPMLARRQKRKYLQPLRSLVTDQILLPVASEKKDRYYRPYSL